MKTRLLQIISILILTTCVLMIGRGVEAMAKQQALQPVTLPVPAAPSYGVTTRISVASNGTQGNYASSRPSISSDGRYVAFESYSNNLVSGDTNDRVDIFVHDRQTGSTERVSIASDGSQANEGSESSSISADGRYIAFVSYANNLVDDDTNQRPDIFVHDRQTGGTQRVSIASDSTQGNGGSFFPSISADGRYVAFYSDASNLVVGDTNGYKDVFVHDRLTGITERISLASDGSQGNDDSWSPSLSADGRYVAFASYASNLVSGDTNLCDIGIGEYKCPDVFVHDRQTGSMQRVSIASDGSQGSDWSGSPGISADGRFVAFSSRSWNLVGGDTNGSEDVFVHDRQTGITERISLASDGSQGDDGSFSPSLSADGHHVAFASYAGNLVSGDTNYFCSSPFEDPYNCIDIFVHDLQTSITERISLSEDGNQGNNDSYSPSISVDGRYVAFDSLASNLVRGDTNESGDVFVHDRQGRNFLLYLSITQNRP